MRGINKIELLGNLGADPELRYFPDGTPAAKISLAVSEQWKDKKNKRVARKNRLVCRTVHPQSCAYRQ